MDDSSSVCPEDLCSDGPTPYPNQSWWGMEWFCMSCLPYLASSCILVFTNQMGLVSEAEVMPGEQKRNRTISTRTTLTVWKKLLICQLPEFCLESCSSLQFESDSELPWEMWQLECRLPDFPLLPLSLMKITSNSTFHITLLQETGNNKLVRIKEFVRDILFKNSRDMIPGAHYKLPSPYTHMNRALFPIAAEEGKTRSTNWRNKPKKDEERENTLFSCCSRCGGTKVQKTAAVQVETCSHSQAGLPSSDLRKKRLTCTGCW